MQKNTVLPFLLIHTVWNIELTLSVDVQIGLRGTMQVSGNLNAALQARGEITPTAYASVTASVSVSLLIGRAGLSLTGSTEYRVGAEVSINTCWVNPSVAVTVYEEWPGVQITLSAFYQSRSYSWWSGFSWGELHRYDIFSTPISSSGGRRTLYTYPPS
jgi:hypothetical protein